MAVESGIINNTGPSVVLSETGDVILQTLTPNRSTRLVSTTGEMRITPGATSAIAGANVSVGSTAAAGGTVSFLNGPSQANTWTIDASGNLIANSATGGYLELGRLGQGLRLRSGSNAQAGTAVLVAGTVTVSSTNLGSTTQILLTSQVDGGTPGFLRVTAKVPGVSFTITSSSGTDTSTVAYLLFTLV